MRRLGRVARPALLAKCGAYHYYTKAALVELDARIHLFLLGFDASTHLPYQSLVEIGILIGKGLHRSLQALHVSCQGRYRLLVG